MNRDFVEMFAALSAAAADFLVVGAHAVAAHGSPRATGDLDIWVRPTRENARCVWSALVAYGAPLHELTLDDLASPGIVFQIGVVPCRIDLLTSITGVEFERAWAGKMSTVIEGVQVQIIGRAELLENKRATARPKDLADVAALVAGEE